jgi:hypothetical protein
MHFVSKLNPMSNEKTAADVCNGSSCQEFQASELVGSPSVSGPFVDSRGLFSLGP